MYENFGKFVAGKGQICVIQAENPDGDSLGSALALEEALGEREVVLYCPVDIPKYMRYFEGHGRVTNEFPYKADGYIIVDTAAATLLSKLLDDAAMRNCLETGEVLVIDHHETEADLPFSYEKIIEMRSSTCALLYEVFDSNEMEINAQCAEDLLYGMMSDTLGMTSQSVTAGDYRVAGALIDKGAKIAEMEDRRREYMKKSPRILDYKADLIKRVEYHLDGKLATVLIPFEDIQEFSDEYNPNVLILEELRLVEGVELAVAIKTYPDGKLTGKIRAAKPVAEQLAGFFGGGGHPYAAGFRVYESYEQVLPELVGAAHKLLEQ
ncbi:MAG: DHH family phosphoesterase [Candidatus Nomurabacteria bacterium]|jgi:phosphoesterase RecJ-like protein|nr:DHH family phosphoesterase [Candidatus Nomurabacteria bacterium]